MKRLTKLIAFALLAAMAVLGQSKASKPAAAAKSSATRAPSDIQIEQAIKAKLAKSKIGKDGFKVKVQGGIATWEGKTDVIQHKGAATRMAKTAGATSVVNNIQISDSAKQSATDNLEKARTAKVKKT